MHSGFAISIAAAALTAACASPAFAWGGSGHRWASGLAAERLPEEVPAFVRSEQAVADIAELGVELDRSRGAGDPHDAERNPGHFVNIDDQGLIAGGVPLTGLPPTREAYDAALRAAPERRTQYRAGYLPYAILDGWQQIVKDFALWRAANAGARLAATEADRRWFENDRKLREILTVRDIGVWSHYVADASQPLHVSIHYNGWSEGPNPEGFTQERGIHARFETAFVDESLTRATVAQLIPDFKDCNCPVQARVASFLADSHKQVPALYRLEKAGAFAPQAADRAAGSAFASQRIAAGSAEIRDLIVLAWRASGEAKVGFPPVPVSDLEAGRAPIAARQLGGE